MQHIGRAHARHTLRLLSRHIGVPTQCVVVVLQRFGQLPQQQSARRAGLGGPLLHFGVQRSQPGLVLGRIQQRRTLRVAGVVLCTLCQHLSSFARLAQRRKLACQRPAQRRGLLRSWLQPSQHFMRLFGFAGFAQQLGAQQRHLGLRRESRHYLPDDGIHQFGLFQPLCQAAKTQPCLQVIGQTPLSNDVVQHRDDQRRLLTHCTSQRGQAGAPTLRLCHEGRQFALCLPLLPGAQGQAGGYHALGLTASGRQCVPKLQRLASQRILVSQQRNAGSALGQDRVLHRLGGIQIMPRRFRQMTALQGEFTRQTGLQRIHLRQWLRRLAGQRRCRASQQQQQ